MALRAGMSGGNSMWRTGKQLQGIPSCSAAQPGGFCLQGDFAVPPKIDGGNVSRSAAGGQSCSYSNSDSHRVGWPWILSHPFPVLPAPSVLGMLGCLPGSELPCCRHSHTRWGWASPAELLVQLPSRVTRQQQRAATRQIWWRFLSNNVCKAPLMSRDEPLRPVMLMTN